MGSDASRDCQARLAEAKDISKSVKNIHCKTLSQKKETPQASLLISSASQAGFQAFRNVLSKLTGL